MYANFGRTSDFRALERAGINVTGKIVIMRYGPTSRGTKVNECNEKLNEKLRFKIGCVFKIWFDN